MNQFSTILAITFSILWSCSREDVEQVPVEIMPIDFLIESYEGQLVILDEAPQSVELDELVSDTALFIFAERTDHSLTVNLNIDLSQPGDFFPDFVAKDEKNWEALKPSAIAAGTKVHSLYFHYDNETYNDDFSVQNYLNCIGQYQINAKITFNFPVLGIIMRASGGQDHLRESDSELGLWNVDYCEHNLSHFPGINIADGCHSDRFILSEDRRTLTVRNNTDIHHDNYRVILAAE